MPDRSAPIELNARVTHRLWPELGQGTVIELVNPLNSAGERFRGAKVRWDNYGLGRAMTYHIGSLRSVQ